MMIPFYEYRGNYLHVFSCIQNHLYFEKHWIVQTSVIYQNYWRHMWKIYLYLPNIRDYFNWKILQWIIQKYNFFNLYLFIVNHISKTHTITNIDIVFYNKTRTKMLSVLETFFHFPNALYCTALFIINSVIVNTSYVE